MSADCKLLFKLHYSKKLCDAIINKNKAINEAMKIPLYGGFMAAAVSAGADIEVNKIKDAYINGPICGGHLIVGGRVDWDKVL